MRKAFSYPGSPAETLTRRILNLPTKSATTRPKSRRDCLLELFGHFSSATIIVRATVDSDKIVRTSPDLTNIVPAIKHEGTLFIAPAWQYMLLLSLVLVLSWTMALDLTA
ncbi:hypothetical protein [Acuticoccus yangtzensis]|uniref:hypothetical protein n=1 Tax=Acuticoccus yangtzensis TaxID=1443441 RepID=UPI000949AFFB|nr:hypothetical protein [Acuticoccus yangtzensis]